MPPTLGPSSTCFYRGTLVYFLWKVQKPNLCALQAPLKLPGLYPRIVQSPGSALHVSIFLNLPKLKTISFYMLSGLPGLKTLLFFRVWGFPGLKTTMFCVLSGLLGLNASCFFVFSGLPLQIHEFLRVFGLLGLKALCFYFFLGSHGPQHRVFTCFRGSWGSEPRVFTCFRSSHGPKPCILHAFGAPKGARISNTSWHGLGWPGSADFDVYG